MLQKQPQFVGVFNPKVGERYIDISQITTWGLDDSTGKLTITLQGTYTQNDRGEGDCDYWFFRDQDMGFDALVEKLRAVSEKLWEDE